MPRVRDLLYRFRPAGAPGAATPAGVPVDRRADLAAELAPLFAQLTDVEQECAAIRAQANRDAEAIRDRGVAQARAVVADAAVRSQAERAGASAQAQRRAGHEATTALADAQRSAEELRRRAAPLLADYVDQVVDRVRSLVSDESVPAAETARS